MQKIRLSKYLGLVIVNVLTGVSFAQESGDTAESYIRISGNKTLSYQGKYLLEGIAPPGFYPIRLRDDALNLRVDGRLKGLADIEGTISDRGIPGEGDGLYFLLKGSSFEAYFGDYSASFTNTSLILQDKFLTGVKGKGAFASDRIQVEGLYSTSRGEPQRERITGDGSQGPFQLERIPIVYGSERVRIGKGLALDPMQKGVDYDIDYQTGEITFIDRMTREDEIIEIDYEWSPTGGKSSLQGVHSENRISKNVSFGATYVKNSQSILDSTSARELYGFNNQITFREILRLNSEIAKDGEAYAYKGEGETRIGKLSLRPFFRRTEPRFSPIGKGLFSNVADWGASGDWKITEEIGMAGDYKNLKEGTRHQIDRGTSATIGIGNLPKLEYTYNAFDEGSDWRRTHKGTVRKDFKYIALHTNYGYEEGTDGKSAKGTYNSDIYGAGLSTRSISILSLSANALHEPNYNTYEVSSSFALSSMLSLSGSFALLEENKSPLDSAMTSGARRTARLGYRTQPVSWFNSQGRYTIEALRKASEPAETHTASFKLELKPMKSIALQYNPNFKFTDLESGTSLYNSNSNQYGVLWNPNKYLRSKYTLEHRNLLAYRESNPEEKTGDNRTRIEGIGLGIAPLAFLSVDLDGRRENQKGLYLTFIPSPTDTLADTLSLYKTESKRNLGANTTIRIHKKASLQFGGSHEDMSLVIPDSMPTITETQGLNSKLTQEMTAWLFLHGNFSYKRTKGQDPWISATNTNICVNTYAPGFGITVNIPNLLKAELLYSLHKSSGDASTHKDELTLNFNITQKHFHLPFNLKYELSRDPDYRILTFSTNLNIEM